MNDNSAEWQKLFTTYIETLHRINKFKSNKKLSVKMCACLSHAHRCPVHRSQRKASKNLRGGVTGSYELSLWLLRPEVLWKSSKHSSLLSHLSRLQGFLKTLDDSLWWSEESAFGPRNVYQEHLLLGNDAADVPKRRVWAWHGLPRAEIQAASTGLGAQRPVHTQEWKCGYHWARWHPLTRIPGREKLNTAILRVLDFISR